MTEITCIFTRLDDPLVYDNSVKGTEIDEIPCDKTSIQNLNQANNQFRFHYTGDFGYLMASPDSGVLVKCRFRTTDNNATNINSNITLAFNWFGYLFEDVQLRLGGTTLEHVRHLGVVTDEFYHMENNEFRHQTGELVGFIPDTSSKISNTIGTREGNVAGADAFAIIGSVNNANQRNVQTNENYNEGFVRRRKLYNYTVAANDDYRYIELFIPLNRILSFCDEINRLLKYIPFEIVLTRSGNNTHCVYGAGNTNIDFLNNDSGITSITLQLERVKMRPDIASDLEKLYKKTFNVAYY